MNVLKWIAKITLPAVGVGALLLAILQTDIARRWLVVLADPLRTPAAAANVGVLRPTVEGADLQRVLVPVELQPIVTGIPQPTDLAPIPGHADRLVVLSKPGTAYLATPGGPATPWFTIDVETASELGLLGITFHPRFAENGRFYVDATPKLDGRLATRVTRWHVDPVTLVGPTLEGLILEVEQPYANHNGGQIAFGPDGALYIALGDGGYRDDPQGNGQNLGSLLGKILRIDVDGGDPYRIPPDNPFVGRAGARGEIWAWGLRNPWRFTFDPEGRMLVGDVGQNRLEEIDLVAKGDNLGWRIREGEVCFDPPTACPETDLVDPIWSYGRTEGASVTGGVVSTARGPLAGLYVFGDYATGRLWALSPPDQRRRIDDLQALGRFTMSPSAFARAPDGNVWVADLAAGAVFRIVTRP